MNYLIVMFFVMLSSHNLLSWIIPYALNVSWNPGHQKRTYLLVGSRYTGPFGAFKDKQEFKNKTSGKLSILGNDEVFPSYTFVRVSYADASTLDQNGVKFVWVSEENIKDGFKQRKGRPQQEIHYGIVNYFKRQGTSATPVAPSGALYTSDGTRKTWGAASNNTWTHFFNDTVYANKPTTMGPGVDFRKYYSFMNTYPEGNMPPEANQGPAPIKLGLYYDIGNIGNPVHTWYHAESYYQAMKKVYPPGYDAAALAQVLNWDQQGQIMQIYGAYKGRIIGLRQDWQTINLFIMLDVVRAKFMQNKNMRDLLLSTGDKYIVEESTDRSPKAKDSFFGNEVGQFDSKLNTWVTDPNKQPGMGSNILGQILMHVRKELKAGMLLPVTLYTEPIDFFNAQKGRAFAPLGKTWNFLPSQSGLKQPCDTPLLIPPVITIPPPISVPPVTVPPQAPEIPAFLQEAMNQFIVALRQLALALGAL